MSLWERRDGSIVQATCNSEGIRWDKNGNIFTVDSPEGTVRVTVTALSLKVIDHHAGSVWALSLLPSERHGWRTGVQPDIRPAWMVSAIARRCIT